jgi:hypothetical protein
MCRPRVPNKLRETCNYLALQHGVIRGSIRDSFDLSTRSAVFAALHGVQGVECSNDFAQTINKINRLQRISGFPLSPDL